MVWVFEGFFTQDIPYMSYHSVEWHKLHNLCDRSVARLKEYFSKVLLNLQSNTMYEVLFGFFGGVA